MGMIQIAALHARGDARRHQERRGALGHARVVAWDATVFHLAPTATRMHAHVMHASKPMGTSSSAPEQIERDHMHGHSELIWIKSQSYIYMLWVHINSVLFRWQYCTFPSLCCMLILMHDWNCLVHEKCRWSGLSLGPS